MSKQLHDIVMEIREANGTKAKQAVLASHKGNKELLQLLEYTYNPRKTYGLTMASLDDYWTMKNGDSAGIISYFLLDKLISRELSGNDAREELRLALSIGTDESRELLTCIINRSLKISMKGKSINKAVGFELIPVTPYMGAKSYNPKLVKKIFDNNDFAYSEIKMDGRYLNLVLENDSMLMESRQGDRMGPNFHDYFSGLLGLGLKPTVLNGELTINGMDRYTSNGVIASYVAHPERPITHDVVLTVWDSIPLDAYKEGKFDQPRSIRLHDTGFIVKLANRMGCTRIKMIEWITVDSVKEAHEHYQSAVSRGEEGTILKSPTGIWENGKPSHQVKFKPVEYFDLLIVGFNYGEKGKKNEHVISSIDVESSDGLVRAKAQGLTEKTMKYVTENQEFLLGTICEVKGIGLSQNKEGSYSIMSPYFCKFRDDKVEAHSLEECKAIHEANFSLS